MSKKDTSLENIDLVKLLIFILAFIVVCFIMILAFIVPNIKEYRNLARENNSVLSVYSKVKQTHDTKQETLNKLKDEHKFIISSYDSKFDKDKFIKFASNFFSDVSLLEANDTSTDEKYFLYKLSVVSSIKTPQKFYDFLESLSKYESIIRADFPIQMRGEGDKIHTTFNIKVYGQK
ncbi:hypothetical protein [Campylobacter mucosalis]|uniref:Uncharacterized protein n=1 Tax=Campylobacter mucosalis CCUG 21559 TaxID=1032067 RepID=A0A6G5QHW4_9BACT|nr:hypothetical protein [Campylobacter mucosalis]QCD45293.1 hypothetical protein CMUC_1534 [Campylobacter mucosalis CCUG 21559]